MLTHQHPETSSDDQQSPSDDPTPAFKPLDLTIDASPGFAGLLAQHNTSLAFSTYQANKLFFIGVNYENNAANNNKLSLAINERTFRRCMGLAVSPDARTIWVATLYQLWRLDDYLAPDTTETTGVIDSTAARAGHDAMFVPTLAHTTGELNIHDVCLNEHNEPTFVATLFNCIATPAIGRSFTPIWKPPFITPPLHQLPAEDRCHLNGLCTDPRTNQPAYATAIAPTDSEKLWKEHRAAGGLLIDIRTNQILASNLSMPHSPRIHPDNPGRIYLLNSGTGHLGYVDLNNTALPPESAFQPIAFCPGFARGLTFIKDNAVVGLSAVRENRTFGGLQLGETLRNQSQEAACGLDVINLSTHKTTHTLRLKGAVRELYDVAAIPNKRKPKLLGFKTDHIQRTIRPAPPNPPPTT